MRIDPAQPVPAPVDSTSLRPGREAAATAAPARDAAAVQAAVGKLNQVLPDDLRASFKLVEDANIVVVQLIDSQTGEVKRQFPSEWVVNTAERISEALGMLLDKKA